MAGASRQNDSQAPLATVPRTSNVATLDQRNGGFHMTKGNLRRVASRAINGTVPPRRVPNSELRTREYLTEFEVNRLIKAAKANRHGQRDATMILLAFRHGLRAAELVDLRWDQVDLGGKCVSARAPGQEWHCDDAPAARR
jgi:integrase